MRDFLFREALIKSGMQIAQTYFSSGGCRPQDCMKMTQEYLMYFKKFRAIWRKICKQDACYDLFSVSLVQAFHYLSYHVLGFFAELGGGFAVEALREKVKPVPALV